MVFLHEHRDFDLSFHRSQQGQSVLRRSIFNRVPLRATNLTSRVVIDTMDENSQRLAKILPAFVNNKALRVGWSDTVAPHVRLYSSAYCTL